MDNPFFKEMFEKMVKEKYPALDLTTGKLDNMVNKEIQTETKPKKKNLFGKFKKATRNITRFRMPKAFRNKGS